MVSITKKSIAKYLKGFPSEMNRLNTPRKFENAVEKRYNEYLKIYNTSPVKAMTVQIEYSKAGNAKASVRGVRKDGSYFNGSGFSATGSGYNKSIDLLSRVLNTYAKSNLLHKKSLANMEYTGAYNDGCNVPYYSLGHDEIRKGGYLITKTANGSLFEQFEIIFK